MCFSASASFTASAVIGAIGMVAVVKTRSIPQLLLATIPLIFSLQQLSEGLLWLSFKQEDLEVWRPLFTYVFLIFAMAIWPLWIPLTIRLLEQDEKRKKILTLLTVIGAFVSATVLCLLFIFPVAVIPTHHHLHYEFYLPQSATNLIGIFTVFYILATIGSSFISSFSRMKLLGIVFLAAYLVSLAVFPGAVISVWCYFAALMSFVVIWILAELIKTDKYKVLASV